VLPGSAERIFTMAEKQLEHRTHLEKGVVEGGSKRASMGIYAGAFGDSDPFRRLAQTQIGVFRQAEEHAGVVG